MNIKYDFLTFKQLINEFLQPDKKNNKNKFSSHSDPGNVSGPSSYLLIASATLLPARGSSKPKVLPLPTSLRTNTCPL